jgi:ABC-2 type transport system permease protein
MRKTLTIALLHLRLTFQSKAMIGTMVLMPLLLTFIFSMLVAGQGGGGGRGHVYPVAVADQDHSLASRLLVEALAAEPTLRVSVVAEAEMPKRFADQAIDSGLIIPAGFEAAIVAGTAPEIKLLTPPGGNLHVGVGPIVRRELARLSADLRLALQKTAGQTAAGQKAGATGAAQPEPGQVEAAYREIAAARAERGVTVHHSTVSRTATGQDPGATVGAVALGFIVTFVMMLVFTMSGVTLKERQQGTWGRLLTTPTARRAVLGGFLLSFFLTGMVQFALLVGASSLLFGIRWGPLLHLFTVAAATVLCAASIGLFLAGLVRTYEQQLTIGILVVNATSMLGGAYWDLSLVSETMRRIGYLTPQAWAIAAFKEVMLRGASLQGLIWPLAVLLGMTAVFLSAGLLRIRFE